MKAKSNRHVPDKEHQEISLLLRDYFNEPVKKSDLIDLLKTTGLPPQHYAARLIYDRLKEYRDDQELTLDEVTALFELDTLFFTKLLRGHLIIPDFQGFSAEITAIYEETKLNTGGRVATYIPQLARVNPEYFGVSICTIDGQVFSIGDSDTFFCLQSGCKPINYCLIQEEHGAERVHQFIGKEPSGHSFNTLSLNDKNLPHNPLINAGAIMACSLLQNKMGSADRFEFLMSQWKSLCGNVISPRFNNAVYLSEKSTADRNYAIGHFIREKNVFPKGIDLDDVLEFYFQCCSIEMTTEAIAIAAGTLANAGICPLSSESIFQASHVKNCLSLMSSCGMYDFSGEFAFSIGLPAKSGVSGILYVVVPNVMGICIWSPALDPIGNSVRGLDFCNRLISQYNFHTFDSLVRSSDKKDPRYKPEI